MPTTRRLLIVSWILLSGCGSDGDQKKTSCSEGVGGTCTEVLKPGGGEVRWNIGGLNPGEEYIIALYTPDVEDPNRMSPRSVGIEAADGSANPPAQEQREIEQTLARQRSNPFRNRDQDLEVSNNVATSSHFSSSGATSNFYVPTPGDYSSGGENGIRQFRIRSQTSPSGSTYLFESLVTVPNVFELLFNQGLVANATTTVAANKRARYKQLARCLETTLPPALRYLGMPIDLDNDPEIKILLTNLGEQGNTATLGFFSPSDRHERSGQKPLSDSNKGEFIYLQPETSKGSLPTDRLCSTAPHEIAHAIRYDSSTLANLPRELWADIREAERRKLWGEWRALDEGYAHMVEMLTGLPQSVSNHLYDFFTEPNGTTLSANDEFPSRGFATAFILRVIQRLGGTLELNDPTTQGILRELIRGKSVGLKNIAALLGETEEELMTDFVSQFAMSLYDSKASSQFLPALKTGVSPNGEYRITRGIEFQSRQTRVESISFSSPSIHPYQVDIPLLRARENLSMKPQGLHLFRYIVPTQKTDQDEIIFSAETTGLYVILTRVR